VREALSQAGLSFSDLDAVGVTQGPGLVGSLLVGITYAKPWPNPWASRSFPSPSRGHVHAVFLEAHKSDLVPELPRSASSSPVATRSLRSRAEQGTRAEATPNSAIANSVKHATTLPAKAYDKVSKLLGLGYPGRPNPRSPGRSRGFRTRAG